MPAAPVGTRRSTSVYLAVESIQSGVVSVVSRWRNTRALVHATVATVAMPSRS